MSDATSPMPAAQPAPTSSAQNDNVMAAVATIPVVGLIIYFAMADASEFVKFYAKQSIGLLIIGIALSVVGFVVGFIPFLGWIISLLLGLLNLGIFIAWLVLLINALQGNRFRLPVVADMTDQLIK